MINLLPQEEKELREKEYRWRKVVVYEYLTLFLLIVSLIIVSVFHYSAFLEERNNKILLEEARRDSGGATLSRLQADSKDLKMKLGFFSRFNKFEIEIADIIEGVVGARPEGISFSSFSFERKEDENKLMVRGNANLRSQLLQFADNIKALNFVVSLDSPVSNLIKETDVPFTFEIKIKKSTQLN